MSIQGMTAEIKPFCNCMKKNKSDSTLSWGVTEFGSLTPKEVLQAVNHHGKICKAKRK